MVEQAESLVYKWNGEIREALERELKKVKNTIVHFIVKKTTIFLFTDTTNSWPIGRNRLVARTKHHTQ